MNHNLDLHHKTTMDTAEANLLASMPPAPENLTDILPRPPRDASIPGDCGCGDGMTSTASEATKRWELSREKIMEDIGAKLLVDASPDDCGCDDDMTSTASAVMDHLASMRSEERRVGKECS